MYKVCGLRLGPNFVVRLAADKNFLFAVCGREKSLFAVFSDKYLRSYGCSDTNFTAMVNWNHEWVKSLKKNQWNTNQLFILLLVTNLFVHNWLIDLVIDCGLHRLFWLRTHWWNVKAQKRIENIDIWLLFLVFVSPFRFHKWKWRILEK